MCILKHFLRSKTLLIALLIFVLITCGKAQENEIQYKVACVAFYNVENLFDTKDDEGVIDEEYTPESDKKWDDEKYNKKLVKLSEVISKIGTDKTPDGAAILGVSEIENRGVLEDLVKTDLLKSRGYEIVHYDSPDRRGVDVGFLYQPKYFEVTNSKKYRLLMDGIPDYASRDQLMVSGIFDGEPLHVIVNHWPSRRGGEKASRPKRNAAGTLCRTIVDSLLGLDPNAKIIVMGDLNDDPNNESVKEHLRATGNIEKMKDGDLFNTMDKLFKSGVGSLAYRDKWNLFDQIIISPALLGDDKSTYKFWKAIVFNKKFLTSPDGRYKGYPMRTFSFGVFINGYSDHFPTFIYLIREVK